MDRAVRFMIGAVLAAVWVPMLSGPAAAADAHVFGPPRPPARSSVLARPPTGWRLTGTIALQSRIESTDGEPSPWAAGPFAWGSNSRVELARGRTRLSLQSTKAAGFRDRAQPDRFYTLQFTAPGISARSGDLDPRFTPGLTGFVRVAGTDARVALGSRIEMSAIRGASKKATPAVGPIAPSLAQRFGGERIVVKPHRLISLGLSRIRMTEEPVDGGPKARDNLLVGSDLTCQLPRRRGSVTVEYAVGLATLDRLAPSRGAPIPGEGGFARAIARRGSVRATGFDINDSTRAGEMIAARLAWTVPAGRASLEYRRTSANFLSLALPYERSDLERVRANGSTRLLGGKATLTTFADWSRDNRSHRKLITGSALSTSASLTVTPRAGRRLVLSWRQSGRSNDAIRTPEALWDPRIDSESRSLSLTDSRELRVGPGMNVGLTLSENHYDDRIRGGANYNAFGAVFDVRSLPGARHTFAFRAGHSISERSATPGERSASDLLVRLGMQNRRFEVHAEASGSLARDPLGEEMRATTCGAGGGYQVDRRTRIEVEGAIRRRHDRLYTHLGDRSESLELRLQRTL